MNAMRFENSHFLDSADEVIFRATSSDLSIAPTKRYLQYLPLLHSPDLLEGFGLTTESVLYRSAISKQTHRSLSAAEGKLRRVLELFCLDYCVVNYWSPLDRRRHSVVLRRPPFESQHELYALLFFGLTFAGPIWHLPRWQLIHFIGEMSALKPTLGLSYGDYSAEAPHSMQLVIDDQLLAALKEIFVAPVLIEDAVRRLEPEQISAALAAVLANERDGKWMLILNGIFHNDTITGQLALFDQRIDRIYGQHKTSIDQLCNGLRLYLGEPGLMPQDVAFMLGSNLLWREACPTRYTYVFPTRVLGSSCILTVGRSAPLDSESWLELRSFSRSLFINSLAHDAGVLDSKIEAREKTIHHYGHTMGHRVAPIIAYLERHAPDNEALACARNLAYMSMLLQAYAVEDVEEFFRINAAKNGRFVDYESSLDFIGLLERFRFLARQDVDEGDGVIRREPLIEWEVESATIECALDDPVVGRKCRLHEAFYLEIAGELLNNAVRHGARLESDENRGEEGVVGVRVAIDSMTLNEVPAIVFINYFTERRKSRPVFFTPQWIRWPRDRENDGPGMAAAVLRATGAGDLWVRCDPPAASEPGVVYAALTLSGLRISEAEA